LERAREWLLHQRSKGFLLRGEDLTSALHWLQWSPGQYGDSIPTSEQVEYIEASREHERDELQRYRSLYESLLARALSDRAEAVMSSRAGSLSRSLLLAVESLRLQRTSNGDRVLRLALQRLLPCVATIKHPSDQVLYCIAFRRDTELEVMWSKTRRRTVTQIWKGRRSSTVEMGEAEWQAATTTTCDSRVVDTALNTMAALMLDLRRKDQEPDFLSWHPSSDVLIARTRLFAAPEGTLTAWDTKTASLIWSGTFERSMVDFEFSDDGRQWIGRTAGALGSGGTWIERVWDARTGRLLSEAEIGQWPYTECAFKQDLPLGFCRRRTSPNLSKMFEQSAGTEARTNILSNDGRMLISLTQCQAQLWELPSGRMIRDFAHDAAVTDAVWTNDGIHVLTGDADGAVRIWAIESGAEVARFEDQGAIRGLLVSTDGKHIAIVTPATIRVCRLEFGRAQVGREHVHAGEEGSNDSGAMPNAWRAEIGNTDTLCIRDDDGNAQLLAIPGKALAVCFGANGTVLATLCHNDHDLDCDRELSAFIRSRICIWALHGGWRQIDAWGRRDMSERCVDEAWRTFANQHLEFSPDAKYLFASYAIAQQETYGDDFFSDYNGWIVFSVEKANAVAEGAWRKKELPAMCFSPNSRYLAVERASSMLVLDLWTGGEVADIAFEARVLAVAFTSDSSFVAAGGIDRTVRLLRIASPKSIVRLTQGAAVSRIEFSADGRFLATAGDTSVRVWTVTGTEVMHQDYERAVDSIRFPRSDSLSIAFDDGSHVELSLEMGDLFAAAERRLTRNLTEEEWAEFMGEQPYQSTFASLPAAVVSNDE
jgi:WD40 repeat protein